MSSLAAPAVALWEYRDIAAPPPVRAEEEPRLQEPAPALPLPLLFTEDEVAARVRAAQALATAQAEERAEAQEALRLQQLRVTLTDFAAQRSAYFKSLETEVVQLSLAIARKILQREAQLDPTLLLGLVRVALDGIRIEPPVRLRVDAGAAEECKRLCATWPALEQCEVVPDSTLGPGDCVIETELGTAHAGLEAQVKEIEASFLDLLAKRPEDR